MCLNAINASGRASQSITLGVTTKPMCLSQDLGSVLDVLMRFAQAFFRMSIVPERVWHPQVAFLSYAVFAFS